MAVCIYVRASGGDIVEFLTNSSFLSSFLSLYSQHSYDRYQRGSTLECPLDIYIYISSPFSRGSWVDVNRMRERERERETEKSETCNTKGKSILGHCTFQNSFSLLLLLSISYFWSILHSSPLLLIPALLFFMGFHLVFVILVRLSWIHVAAPLNIVNVYEFCVVWRVVRWSGDRNRTDWEMKRICRTFYIKKYFFQKKKLSTQLL